MLATRMLRAAFVRTKASTGITGLAVHPAPFQALRETYNTTLEELKHIPSSAVYRQATEAITSHRLSLVERAERGSEDAESLVQQFEKEIDEAHCIEEVIDAAQTELQLVKSMKEWKAWESLSTPAPPGQWDGFNVPPSTTMPES